MRRVVYMCDHCKREFPAVKIQESIHIECGGARYDCDLCDGCITELRLMLRLFTEVVEEADNG